MRLDAVERLVDAIGIGAVAADEAVPPKQPHIPGHRDRVCGRFWRLVGIGKPAIWRQAGEFVFAEPGQRQVEAHLAEIGQLDPQQRVVPPGVQRELIVGQNVGLLLRLRPAPRYHDGRIGQAELPGG